MFGGFYSTDAGHGKTDTWTFDPSTGDWTQHTPTHTPPRRGGHILAYSAPAGHVVMFGGNDTLADASPLSDTWTWDGSDWTEQSPSHTPPARGSFAGAAPIAAGVLIYGGNGATGLADTWIWDGSDWIEQSPAGSPPALLTVPMGPCTQTDYEAIIHGGLTDFSPLTYSDETWGWADGDWINIDPATTPSGHRGWTNQLTGNGPHHPGVMMFNGLLSAEEPGGTSMTQTWVLSQPPIVYSIAHSFGLRP